MREVGDGRAIVTALKRQTSNGHEVPAGGSPRGNEKTSVLPVIGDIALTSRPCSYPLCFPSLQFRLVEFISPDHSRLLRDAKFSIIVPEDVSRKRNFVYFEI